MAKRKTDNAKLKEKRGMGRGESYIPWIFVHEFGSSGRATRLMGFKIRRIYHLLSDLEHYFYLITHWSDDVVEIREGYPLLPLESTVLIAKELGIRHPAEHNKAGKEYVMTSDFVITIVDGNTVRDIVRTVKPSGKINRRVKEKFLIEEEYWRRKGIDDWGIVTEKEIPIMLGKNLKFLYCNYFWLEEMNISEDQYLKLVDEFKTILARNNGKVEVTVKEFDLLKQWDQGETWNFIGNMILQKKAKTDLISKKFSYHNLALEL